MADGRHGGAHSILRDINRTKMQCMPEPRRSDQRRQHSKVLTHVCQHLNVIEYTHVLRLATHMYICFLFQSICGC